MTDYRPPDQSNEEWDSELERFDDLLERGFKEVSDIEIDEITKGMTEEEVSGQFGEGSDLKVERSEHSRANRSGDFIFEDAVQFFIEDRHKNISDIPLEEIELLKDVKTGDRIASCKPDQNRPGLFEVLLKEYDRDFQKQAGIEVRADGSQLSFYAARHGKVVVLHKQIHVVCTDRDATCRVHLTPDMMEARMDFNPPRGQGCQLALTDALDELERHNVVKGVKRDIISECIERINTERISLSDIVVAVGQPPEHGKDAEITFHISMESEDIGFRILPDGRIDYKKQAPIKIVQKGDLLVTLKEPQKGRDGFLVSGVVVPAEEGKEDVLIEGENVRRGEDGRTFFAECAGMVSFHDKILNVYPHYQVEGDVDMKSGNILFNGSVTILGTVRSGFEVKTTGDIFITGSVEAADIEAGRDIRINGAVVGTEGMVIKAGRNIFVGHVQNAVMEAQGDIIIVRSAMHSKIYSTGKIYLHDREGSVVGGVINAMQGLECMSIGSRMGTPTEIVAGSDFLVARRKAEIRQIMQYHQVNMTKIDNVLRPLTDLVKKGIPLGNDKKRRLKTIIEKRKSIAKQLRVMKQKAQTLSEIDPVAIKASVIVQETLYQDVVIKIAECILRNRDELKSVKCLLSDDRKSIRMKPLHFVDF